MTIRSIILGACAGLLTVGAAAAADLPMTKGEAVEYVKVCSAFGPGFFYIPGSDTCLQISGQIRADYWYQSNPDPASNKRNINQTQFRTNARIRFDARTQTDYGLLRSFFELQAESNAGTAPPFGTGVHDTFTVRQAYLQFGGLTAGFAWSPYAFYDPKYQAEFFAPYFGEQGRRNLISYTAQFDKAFATLSIEDNRDHRAGTTFGNSGTLNGVAINTEGGAQVPDIVGVIGYDDNKTGWGRVQVMGALHQNRSALAAYGTDWGYSVGAAGNINFPILSGAYIAAEGSYSEGAVKYLGVGGSQPSGSSLLSFGGTDAYASTVAPFDLDRAKGWAIQAEAGLKFTDQLQAVLFGGYLRYDAPNIATSATADFHYYVVGGQLNYTVVKGFIAGAEVWYQNKDPNGGGTTVTANPRDTADSVGAGVRLRRTF
ncbi:porin [Labrys okinawensis]|uniref:porin n=1 Tax=Labrys okinawensis TaxID=346911 RepID=UPI0039BCFCDA